MKHLAIIEGLSNNGGVETLFCELLNDELEKFFKGYELVKIIRNDHFEKIERLSNFLENYIKDGNLNEEDSNLLEWFNDKYVPYGNKIDVINIHATVYENMNYKRIVKLL